MKYTIDNSAILTVEKSLFGGLEDLLSPAYVMKLKPTLMNEIATRSSNNSFRRERLSRKVTILKQLLGLASNMLDVILQVRRAKRKNTGIDRQNSSPTASSDSRPPSSADESDIDYDTI